LEKYLLDICLVIPLVWGCIRGVYKGLMLSIGSLVGLILGIYLANAYASDFSELLLEQFVLSKRVAYIFAFFIIFASVAFIAFLLSKLLDKFFKVVMLGWVNRLLGAVFEVLKYALIVSVCLNLLTFADNYLSFIPEERKQESVLYEPLLKMVPTVLPYVKFCVTDNGKN